MQNVVPLHAAGAECSHAVCCGSRMQNVIEYENQIIDFAEKKRSQELKHSEIIRIDWAIKKRATGIRRLVGDFRLCL